MTTGQAILKDTADNQENVKVDSNVPKGKSSAVKQTNGSASDVLMETNS